MRELNKKEFDDILATVGSYAESRVEYTKRMESAGYTIFVPLDNELQIDIDSEEAFLEFKRRFSRFVEDPIMCYCKLFIKPSKSGLPHRHAKIELPVKVNAAERIAWQAILGSDHTREMLSMLRNLHGDAAPSLLAMKDDNNWIQEY